MTDTSRNWFMWLCVLGLAMWCQDSPHEGVWVGVGVRDGRIMGVGVAVIVGVTQPSEGYLRVSA